ncbi:LysR family transcriptional regulator [Xylocopilactobacillus apis]|uniref:LysR family transcriptional regulator n=1 Tax=Xylocopilactobacillus apis TaxID=2932183 RepID=A0AAU9DQ96_9LACO|nr:LysR family transcriptional regulator [Xylocopilactobacillus apis]BDR57278.1 LysR family transcriptional regulator [Xylocopilactobacillus apis]
MNFRDLEYFNKLVELRNYSQTARYFQVTQPTISYTIKRLEDQIGATLIERETMNLTLAGQQFYEHTQKISFEMQLLDKDIDDILSPKIKIGLPPIITNYLLNQSKYLKIIKKNLNKLEVHSSESQQSFRDLLNGELDASFIGSVNPITVNELESQILTRHHFKIICSNQSPLAKKKSVSFDDLKEEKFILLDKETTHQQVFAQLMSRHLFNPNIIFRTSNFQTILTLVKNNSGISFLTEAALAGQEKELVPLELTEAQNILFYTNLVSRARKYPNPHLESFLKLFE